MLLMNSKTVLELYVATLMRHLKEFTWTMAKPSFKTPLTLLPPITTCLVAALLLLVQIYFAGKHALNATFAFVAIPVLALSFIIMQRFLKHYGVVSQLKESEEKFHTLFNHAGDAIFIVDMRGNITEVNDEAVKRLGYTRAELLTMRADNIDTPEYAASIPDRIAIIQRQGFAFFESSHVSRDGSVIPVEINARLSEYNGCPAIMAVARDITERKLADKLLLRQNGYLRALHETTLGLISRLELHSLLSAIITNAATLMNTEHGYIYLLDEGQTKMVIQVQLGVFDCFEHHPLEYGEGMAGYVWEHREAFHVDDYSSWPGRINDPQRDCLKAMAGIPLKSGTDVVGVIGLAYTDNDDVFDEGKIELLQRFAELASLAIDNARLYDAAQKELGERTKAEESLHKLSHAVEQSPVSIVITDTDGNIEYANPYSTQLTGYEPHELLGQNPRVLKSGFTSQQEYQDMWQTILSGHEWRGEFHNRKKNGEYYWEMALISPIRNQAGTITHFIAIKEDITDRKKLENQLRHSQKMEAVGQLAGGIAHDFNNILTAIIGYATIMQIRIAAESPLKSTVDQILATAERGAGLTQGLLAFSRKQVSNPGRVNLNEIIERVEKLLVRLIGEDIHLITILADQDLPLLADSIQLEQALMNLATNARDAMPEGGTITIGTEVVFLDSSFVATHGFGEEGCFALLSVSDTGYGMEEETIKRIFEPFFTTKEIGKGTGLGLSIAYGIIKKHRGYVTCSSSPGNGTTFRIYLPLAPDTEIQRPDSQDSAPYRGGHELVLLAEDDEYARMLSKELLEEFGYTVIETEDGDQALQEYREHGDKIGLVMLDAMMPGMKGMDVYREIRNINPHARVLLCSGYNPDIMQNKGFLDQNLHFIAKPFMPKELLMKIREVLEDVV